jgi:hypothetical protein
VKRIHLSPVTSLLVSLSLVVGILVCDLKGARLLPAAHAQTGAAHVFHQIAVPAATLAGSVIAAKGVLINGVATDADFVGEVRISDSIVEASGGVYVDGAFPSGGGDIDPANGAFPSGGGDIDPVSGAFPSGGGDIQPVSGAFPSGGGDPIAIEGAFPSGIISSDGGLQVVGGTLQGTNINVTNGIISGDNLVLVGAYVTSSGAQ